MYYNAEFLTEPGGKPLEIVSITSENIAFALIWVREFFATVVVQREPQAAGFRLLDPAEIEVWPYEAMSR